MAIKPMEWRDGHLLMLDQRELPQREEWLSLSTWEEVRDAIRDMAVRGAPAIGVAAAYGMALAAQTGDDLEKASSGLASSRPTAVNLFWALDRINSLSSLDPTVILKEAKTIELEDVAMNQKIGLFGASMIEPGSKVLTICNTGGLATAGHGTALGIIRTAHDQGKIELVYSCETRPRQQGLRLTAWELIKDGIPFKSIADGAAASLMQKGEVDFVVAGADRIAANGDAANKIGTYSLAVCAHHHSIPFVIAAPSSTFDSSLINGAQIPIEERSADELTQIDGHQVAPADCPVYNPAFDVTPAELITAIVTESGIHRQPFQF